MDDSTGIMMNDSNHGLVANDDNFNSPTKNVGFKIMDDAMRELSKPNDVDTKKTITFRASPNVLKFVLDVTNERDWALSLASCQLFLARRLSATFTAYLRSSHLYACHCELNKGSKKKVTSACNIEIEAAISFSAVVQSYNCLFRVNVVGTKLQLLKDYNCSRIKTLEKIKIDWRS
ncbi:hypothetical protein Tco_0332105 [Tanacetum coccineum]